MTNLAVVTTGGGNTQLGEKEVEAFGGSLRGRLLTPDADDYDGVRAIWNAMIDRGPALIVRCAGAADVMRAVNFARKNDLLLAVRGGGHNSAGNAVCEGGLMIDLSLMKSVRVSPKAKTAFVEPGATLGDFDSEAQAFGLATPLGINSTTGVAGLTLGGGFGWLSRKYGMSVDNLKSVDVVTADGALVRGSAEETPDLFWGIRGGGGNFGIVTTFEFGLHQVGPEVYAGPIVFPFDQAEEVLKQYRDFVETMPDELSVWVVVRKAPPLPFLPESVHGKEVVILASFYPGKEGEGQRLIEPLRTFGEVLGEQVGMLPYVEWQRFLDPLLAPGLRNYWKSHNYSQLTDRTISTILEYAAKLPTSETEIPIGLIGGAASRVPPGETAYSQRDAKFVLNVHTRWESPTEDERCIAWARDFFQAAAPDATGGVYVNFLTKDETDRVRAAYRPEVWDRLVRLKKRWDPENLFRMNQNILTST